MMKEGEAKGKGAECPDKKVLYKYWLCDEAAKGAKGKSR